MTEYSLTLMSFRLRLAQWIQKPLRWFKSTAGKFSAFAKIIWTYISRRASKLSTRIISAHYFNYDTIPLRVYVDIVNTGNYRLVSKSKIADVDKCFEVWEQITIAQSEALGGNKHRITLDALKAYNRYCAEYIIINSLLTKCLYKYDENTLKELAGYGFVIDKKDYRKSLEICFGRVKQYLTRMQSKELELKELMKENESRGTLKFGELIANASYGMGFNIREDILLSEFNQYMKILQEKNKDGRTKEK